MLEDIKAVFAETLNLSPDLISLATSMNTLQDWDSMRQVELMVALERRFKIKFKMGELVQLNSVEKILTAVKAKTNALPQHPTADLPAASHR